MKIIKRDGFLQLPTGTIYCKYQPCVFDSLCVKGETLGNNYWYFSELHGNIDTGDDNYIEESTYGNLRNDTEELYRDGLCDEEQLFAVYDKDDIIQLIDKLQECLTLTKTP